MIDCLYLHMTSKLGSDQNILHYEMAHFQLFFLKKEGDAKKVQILCFFACFLSEHLLKMANFDNETRSELSRPLLLLLIAPAGYISCWWISESLFTPHKWTALSLSLQIWHQHVSKGTPWDQISLSHNFRINMHVTGTNGDKVFYTTDE